MRAIVAFGRGDGRARFAAGPPLPCADCLRRARRRGTGVTARRSAPSASNSVTASPRDRAARPEELEAFQESGEHLIAVTEGGHRGRTEIAGARFFQRRLRSVLARLGDRKRGGQHGRRQQFLAIEVRQPPENDQRHFASAWWPSPVHRRPPPTDRRRCGRAESCGLGPCRPAAAYRARDNGPAARSGVETRQ